MKLKLVFASLLLATAMFAQTAPTTSPQQCTHPNCEQCCKDGNNKTACCKGMKNCCKDMKNCCKDGKCAAHAKDAKSECCGGACNRKDHQKAS